MSLNSINTVTKICSVTIIEKTNNPMFIKNYSNEILRKVHAVYSNLILNPFNDPDSGNTITSTSFIKGIDKIVNISFQNGIT
ncbi:hypothetical protein H8356DRAFT_1323383 [Neocallimastix lanati (nom. inval.)]|nr:hypothetical protein H8356DRAFT_1323383 [Neocallimastix sp. JGI-2020a]